MKIIKKENGKTRCYFTKQEQERIEYTCCELVDVVENIKSKAVVDIMTKVVEGNTQGLSTKQLGVIKSIAQQYNHTIPEFFVDFEGTADEWRKYLTSYYDQVDAHEIRVFVGWYGAVIKRPKQRGVPDGQRDDLYGYGCYDG